MTFKKTLLAGSFALAMFGTTVAQAADIVIGMTSSLLFEAALIGRPSIAALVHPVEIECIPDVLKPYLRIVDKRSELEPAIRLCLSRPSDQASDRPLVWDEKDHVLQMVNSRFFQSAEPVSVMGR